jgi:uncharacterized surface protein with fasciclin (FAS1) repeats
MISDVATTLVDRVRHGAGLGVGLLAFILVLGGCDAVTDDDLGDATPQTPSVAGYVSQVRALSALNTAVQGAGDLSVDLANEQITLFAPVNDAFEPAIDPTLNRPVMREVLQHHIVSGAVTTDQLSDGQSVSPLSGRDLSIGVGDAVTVNRATVTNPDADATNGIVHVIDGLLINAVDRAALTPQFTLFARLVGEANLESALQEAGANDGRTLFVPTNEAILDRLDADDNGQLENDEIPSNAADILQYHVLDSVFLAADVPTSETAVETLEGTDLTVVRDGDVVNLDPNDENARVTIPNVEVDNGVIHGIDAVLTP